jgi:hypothetical protein
MLAIIILAASFCVLIAGFYFWNAEQKRMTPQEKAQYDADMAW